MKNKKNLKALLLSASLIAFPFCNSKAESGETIFGVTTNNNLIHFNSETPNAIDDSVAITGLQSGENVVGIDFRPTTNILFALGSTGRLYTVNSDTGAVTLVTTSPFSLTGTEFGFDFNPTADKLRVVSEQDENLRIDPSTGNLFSTDTNLTFDPSDINSAQNPSLVGATYTNNSANSISTTLFGIDSNLNILVKQGDANGTPTSPNTGKLFTVGNLGVDVNNHVGFDVAEAKSGKAFASMTTVGETTSKFYSIDLGGGHATLIGNIGGGTELRDIAVLRAGAIKFSQNAYTVNENSTLTVTVERIGGSSGPTISGTPVPVSVTLSTINGSATAVNDFTAISNQVVTFNEGEVSKNVLVSIVNDSTPELPENFTLALSNPTGGAIIKGSDTAVVNVLDDELTLNNIPNNQLPFVFASIDKTYPKSKFLARGLPAVVICSENCSLHAEIVVSRGIANRFKVGTVLGTLDRNLTLGQETQITIPVISSFRSKLLRKPGTIPVTVRFTATDSDGNTTSKEKRVNITNDIRSRSNRR